jgi:hypothetical protein
MHYPVHTFLHICIVPGMTYGTGIPSITITKKSTKSSSANMMAGSSTWVLVMLASLMKRSMRSAKEIFCSIIIHDFLLTLGRVATWSSNLLGYHPLVMAGAREGLIETASSLGLAPIAIVLH